MKTELKRELTLQDLAPYLPYGLKLLIERKSSFNNEPNSVKIEDWKLTDLDAPFKKRYQVVSCKPLLIHIHQCPDFGILNRIASQVFSVVPDYMNSVPELQKALKGHFKNGAESLPYSIIKGMARHHIDFNGLLDAGLALNKSEYSNI